MSQTLRLSRQARRDIEALLNWSRERFGEAAAEAYEALIEAGFRDLLETPERPGTVARSEIGEGLRSWHLRLSRDRAATRLRVMRPRHFLLYRFELGGVIEVARVLHDAMDLERHLTPEDR